MFFNHKSSKPVDEQKKASKTTTTAATATKKSTKKSTKESTSDVSSAAVAKSANSSQPVKRKLKTASSDCVYQFYGDDDNDDVTMEMYLRPYQEENIKDMWDFESKRPLQVCNLYGSRFLVERQLHCGIFAVKVGGGKTFTTLKFIERYPISGCKRIAAATSLIHVDFLSPMIYYRVNLVVVPNVIFPQWALEIGKCYMTDRFLFCDNAKYLDKFFKSIQKVREDANDEQFSEKNGKTYLNVLCSATFYDALVKSRVTKDDHLVRDEPGNAVVSALPRFNEVSMFMRMFYDEADKNFRLIHTNFMWLISATLPLKIKQAQTLGISYRKDSLLGSLKLASQFFDVYEFCVCTPDEVVDAQCQIPPLKSFRLAFSLPMQKHFLAKCIEAKGDQFKF